MFPSSVGVKRKLIHNQANKGEQRREDILIHITYVD